MGLEVLESEIGLNRETYEETLKCLEDRAYIEEGLRTEWWKRFELAWKAIAESSERQLLEINPENKMTVIKLQNNVKFYRDVIPHTVEMYKKLGAEAYDNAKEQGWLNSFAQWLKTNF